MPHAVDGLDPAQREAVVQRARSLLVVGGPGSGRTRALIARFAWLVEQGEAPEGILVVGADAPDLLAPLEDAIAVAHGELAVGGAPALARRLLRDAALQAGLEPPAEPIGAGDRLALLLGHIDELELAEHDVAAGPTAVLRGFVHRIDALKAELVGAAECAARAAALPVDDEPARARARREREFAAVYATHERLLAELGALDRGDVLLRARRLLDERADLRAALARHHPHVLVDDLDEASPAARALIDALARDDLWATAGHDDALAGAERVVRLGRSHRAPERILRAVRALASPAHGLEPGIAPPGGEIELWRCANARAQAQAVAADIEARLTRDGERAGAFGVLVGSPERDGPAVGVALSERAIAHRLVGAADLFTRAEVRDLLAWLRLLGDPGDAGAVARALARPPIELDAAALARCTQIARRRRLDMVSALAAATESPQLAPEARERVLRFLRVYRAAAQTLDTLRPDLYVHRLIERLGLRRHQLFAAQADVVERLLGLARFGELAAAYARRHPQATARDFARHVATLAEAGLEEAEPPGPRRPDAVVVAGVAHARGLELDHVYVLAGESGVPVTAPQVGRAMARARRRVVLAHPAADASRTAPPALEAVGAALDESWQDRDEELFGPAEALHAAYRAQRDEVLVDVARTGARLGELRLDTDLDVSHAVARYLELLKLAALVARDRDQGADAVLPELNARLRQAATADQREILETSALDDRLLDAERDARRRASAIAAGQEPSLEPFLPRRGEGLVLSASDIDTYRTCPLKYKFARVFRIPAEPTLSQRFGIVVHQVLERFHGAAPEPPAGERARLLGLLDAAWRRGGFGDSEQERQLRAKATTALMRYQERFESEASEPVWFERSFSFRLGPHLLRGRVDRVDRLAGGGYELIDYKTGRPKSPAELTDDVQLSLYAVGAREAWRVEPTAQSYYYVLDDARVPVPAGARDAESITDTVHEVADGILGQGFEPTPSYPACSACDYRLMCPAAER